MTSTDGVRLMSALALAAFLSSACASQPSSEESGPPGRGVAEAPVDSAEQERIQEVKDEINVGKGIASRLLGSYGHYSKAPELDKYINMVGLTVAQQAGRPELTYHFAILDTDEINAFAAPGGYIFVTRGLMRNIKSEDELAGVLGHEVAHVTQKHMYKQIAVKRQVSAGESLARLLSRGGADIGGAFNEMVSKGLKMLLEDGYGKEKEYEADSVGVMYAAAAGYDPTALSQVIIRNDKGKANLKLPKTHPHGKERLAALKKALNDNGLQSRSNADKDVLTKRFSKAIASFKE